MSEFKASGFRDEFGSGGPDLVGITTMTSPYYFVPPSGSTAERPSSPPPGMLRFNTDSGRLEVWRNDHWATILGESPNLGDQNLTNSAGGTGARGLFGGGYSPNVNIIDFVTIATTGNTQDFGDLSVVRREAGGCASRTRGLFGGGAGASREDTIDFVTFSSTGNAQDFGNLTIARNAHNTGLSNSTRGVWSNGLIDGAAPNTTNVIDYVTIASAGNAVDFGDSTQIKFERTGVASAVRGLWGGGNGPINVIDYVTISTTGNAQDFGDLTTSGSGHSACSNSTRAIFERAGTMGFITIASLGNAASFGTLTNTNTHKGACSSSTRGVFARDADIEYVTILTTGNGVDFGDISSTSRNRMAGISNGHGGL
jgi:hypothetical protein